MSADDGDEGTQTVEAVAVGEEEFIPEEDLLELGKDIGFEDESPPKRQKRPMKDKVSRPAKREKREKTEKKKSPKTEKKVHTPLELIPLIRPSRLIFCCRR